MFDRPPKRELLSWIYVVLWSALIFAMIPFVRAATELIDEDWRVYVFTYGVAAFAILAAAAAVYSIRRDGSLVSYIVLAAVASFIVYETYRLSERTPVEAIHFLQYGILSLLLYRAFAHRIRDYSIYAVATVAGTMIGMLDETIQWLTPGRHFATADIWLNFTAVALVQVAIAGGIRPRIISGWPDAAALARLCRVSALAVAFLGVIYLNTADRVAWYAPHLPFVAANQVPMVEYGYLHEPADNVGFRSRFTAEELRSQAEERAEEASILLDAYRERERYLDFLAIYTPTADPFLHEARVHLFGRDVNLELAREAETADESDRRYAIAFWENYILENYFGDVLRASSYLWPERLRAEVQGKAQLDRPYESRVSENVITGIGERPLAVILWGLFALLAALGAWLGAGWTGGRPSAEGERCN